MKTLLPLLLISNFAFASESVICPATIEIEEKLSSKAPFHLFNKDVALKKTLAFSGVHVFDGHPKERADLKPDNGDDALPHFWSLRGKQFWAACSYGSEQKYLLIRQLKSVKHECRMSKVKPKDKAFQILFCK